MISDENLFRCRQICSRTDSSRLIQRQQEGVPSLVPNPTPKVPGSPTYPSTLRVRLKSSWIVGGTAEESLLVAVRGCLQGPEHPTRLQVRNSPWKCVSLESLFSATKFHSLRHVLYRSFATMFWNPSTNYGFSKIQTFKKFKFSKNSNFQKIQIFKKIFNCSKNFKIFNIIWWDYNFL